MRLRKRLLYVQIAGTLVLALCLQAQPAYAECLEDFVQRSAELPSLNPYLKPKSLKHRIAEERDRIASDIDDLRADISGRADQLVKLLQKYGLLSKRKDYHLREAPPEVHLETLQKDVLSQAKSDLEAYRRGEKTGDTAEWLIRQDLALAALTPDLESSKALLKMPEDLRNAIGDLGDILVDSRDRRRGTDEVRGLRARLRAWRTQTSHRLNERLASYPRLQSAFASLEKYLETRGTIAEIRQAVRQIFAEVNLENWVKNESKMAGFVCGPLMGRGGNCVAEARLMTELLLRAGVPEALEHTELRLGVQVFFKHIRTVLINPRTGLVYDIFYNMYSNGRRIPGTREYEPSQGPVYRPEIFFRNAYVRSREGAAAGLPTRSYLLGNWTSKGAGVDKTPHLDIAGQSNVEIYHMVDEGGIQAFGSDRELPERATVSQNSLPALVTKVLSWLPLPTFSRALQSSMIIGGIALVGIVAGNEIADPYLREDNRQIQTALGRKFEPKLEKRDDSIDRKDGMIDPPFQVGRNNYTHFRFDSDVIRTEYRDQVYFPKDGIPKVFLAGSQASHYEKYEWLLDRLDRYLDEEALKKKDLPVDLSPEEDHSLGILLGSDTDRTRKVASLVYAKQQLGSMKSLVAQLLGARGDTLAADQKTQMIWRTLSPLSTREDLLPSEMYRLDPTGAAARAREFASRDPIYQKLLDRRQLLEDRVDGLLFDQGIFVNAKKPLGLLSIQTQSPKQTLRALIAYLNSNSQSPDLKSKLQKLGKTTSLIRELDSDLNIPDIYKWEMFNGVIDYLYEAVKREAIKPIDGTRAKEIGQELIEEKEIAVDEHRQKRDGVVAWIIPKGYRGKIPPADLPLPVGAKQDQEKTTNDPFFQEGNSEQNKKGNKLSRTKDSDDLDNQQGLLNGLSNQLSKSKKSQAQQESNPGEAEIDLRTALTIWNILSNNGGDFEYKVKMLSVISALSVSDSKQIKRTLDELELEFNDLYVIVGRDDKNPFDATPYLNKGLAIIYMKPLYSTALYIVPSQARAAWQKDGQDEDGESRHLAPLDAANWQEYHDLRQNYLATK